MSTSGWVRSALAAAACGFACGAQAAPIDWNAWNSSTSGSIAADSVSVSFSIAGTGSLDNLVPNYPSYTPTGSYADGSTVNNAPVASDGIIRLEGGNTNLNTVTFSKPVVNPVMAIWSLGAPGAPAEFDFSKATPVFVAGGPSAEYGGNAIMVSGDVVSGAESNGTVQFMGTFTSLSWTNPKAEYWYGFDVGIAGVGSGGGGTGVPEPSTLALLGLALLPLFSGAWRPRWRSSRRCSPAV
ncbi:MAG TPA: PEP-CTERM sorting domain-containing protein [Steroidobacteraceae bacterium]|nr:PEP-CTERM sorting domain-containing protein [Steroidobacteraceae bacterium]